MPTAPPRGAAPRIFTIGHSTRTLDELLQLLRQHGIVQLADVRSYPGSRRLPHFGRAALETGLPALGVAYRWMPGLGGRRPLRPDSPHRGWRVDGFRAYADHMQTPEFAAARDELEVWASRAPTAFMCAEAWFRKCHRQLLADALVVRGWEVLHVSSPAVPEPHRLTRFARRAADGHLVYPADGELPLDPG